MRYAFRVLTTGTARAVSSGMKHHNFEAEIRHVPHERMRCAPRYAAHDTPRVLFVHDAPDYECAALAIKEQNAKFPHLEDGLFLEVCWHVGRGSWMLQRHYTTPDRERRQFAEIAWFDSFADAVESARVRQYPNSLTDDELRAAAREIVVDLDSFDLELEQGFGSGYPIVRIDLVSGGKRISVHVDLFQYELKRDPTIRMIVNKPNADVIRTAQVRPWVKG